jgi:hypothetical protein
MPTLVTRLLQLGAPETVERDQSIPKYGHRDSQTDMMISAIPSAGRLVGPLRANSGRSHVGWQWLNSTQAEVYERIRGVRRKADLADRL